MTLKFGAVASATGRSLGVSSALPPDKSSYRHPRSGEPGPGWSFRGPLAALTCYSLYGAAIPDAWARDVAAATAAHAPLIVTANKREEAAQDVPIAMTVLDTAQLRQRNITSVMDLTRAAAALNGGFDVFGTALSIRGIGTASFSVTSEGSVAVVLDGVALANTSELAPQLFDIARVEVLEGPQGTLYGRNASAGLINVVTAQPEMGETSFSARIQAGSRHAGNVQGAVNLPLGRTAALRIAGERSSSADLVHDLRSGSHDRPHSTSLRGRLRLEAGPSASFQFGADYSRTERSGASRFAVYRTTNPTSTNARLLAGCGIAVGLDNAESCTDAANRDLVRSYGFSGQADFDLGGKTLTWIGAYRHLRSGGTIDVDDLPVNVVDLGETSSRYRNFSQEVRLASPGNARFSYVLGGYWLKSKQDHRATLAGKVFSLLLPATNPTSGLVFGRTSANRVDSEGIAAFGQANFAATDRWELFAGFRFGRETLSVSTRRSVAPNAVATFPAQLGTIGDLTPHDTVHDDTYYALRLGGSYRLDEDASAYVSFNRGYKGAAVNDTGSANVVAPEVPTAWEGGIKAALFGRRLRLGLAVFHTRVRNFQTIVYDQTTNSFDFANAPRLTSRGATLSVEGRLSDRFGVLGSFAYTDARYGAGFIVQCAPGQTPALGCETFRAADGRSFSGDEVRGNSVPGTPKWKVSLAADLVQPLSGGLAVFMQPDLVFMSKIRFSQASDANRVTPGRAIAGLRLGLRRDDAGVSLSLYARNLFDQRYPSFQAPLATASLTGDPLVYHQAFAAESFRSVGVALDLSL